MIVPEDFAWTMAFTHEDGWLGPYFSEAALGAEPIAKPQVQVGGRRRRRRK